MKKMACVVMTLALTALATLPVGLTMATPVAADCTTGMGTCLYMANATCVLFDPNGSSPPVVVHNSCDTDSKMCS